MQIKLSAEWKSDMHTEASKHITMPVKVH